MQLQSEVSEQGDRESPLSKEASTVSRLSENSSGVSRPEVEAGDTLGPSPEYGAGTTSCEPERGPNEETGVLEPTGPKRSNKGRRRTLRCPSKRVSTIKENTHHQSKKASAEARREYEPKPSAGSGRSKPTSELGQKAETDVDPQPYAQSD